MVRVYPWISLIFDIDVYFRLRPAHRPGSTAISELEQFSSKRTSSCLPVNPCSPFRRNYHQVLVLLLRLRQICSHPSLIQEEGVAFVHPDDVDASKGARRRAFPHETSGITRVCDEDEGEV